MTNKRPRNKQTNEIELRGVTPSQSQLRAELHAMLDELIGRAIAGSVPDTDALMSIAESTPEQDSSEEDSDRRWTEMLGPELQARLIVERSKTDLDTRERVVAAKEEAHNMRVLEWERNTHGRALCVVCRKWPEHQATGLCIGCQVVPERPKPPQSEAPER